MNTTRRPMLLPHERQLLLAVYRNEDHVVSEMSLKVLEQMSLINVSVEYEMRDHVLHRTEKVSLTPAGEKEAERLNAKPT